MNAAVAAYFERLNLAAGAAWNQFWFTPTEARPLGRIRAAAGVLALVMIGLYAPDLQRWFGAGGMLPVEVVREFYSDQWSPLDGLTGGALWAAWGAGIVSSIAMAVGVGGRAAVIATLVCSLALVNRGPMLTGAFEAVLSMLLAYLCIGNSSATFSWPARFSGPGAPAATSPANTVSLRLIQIHVALIHAMMAVAMFAAPDDVWFSGEGLWLAAAKPDGALIDVSALKDFTKPVALASHFVTAYFLALPIFVWRPLLRPLVLAAAAVVWPLLAVLTGQVLFCAAMAAGTLAFLSPSLEGRGKGRD